MGLPSLKSVLEASSGARESAVHALRSAQSGAVPATQAIAVHASTPVHASASLQSAAVAQVFGRQWPPMHAPTLPAQSVRSVSGVPAAHACVVAPQVSTPLHSSPSSQVGSVSHE